MSFAGMNDPRKRAMLAQIMQNQNLMRGVTRQMTGAAVADDEMRQSMPLESGDALRERMRAETGAAVADRELQAARQNPRDVLRSRMSAESGAAVSEEEIAAQYQAVIDMLRRESGAYPTQEEVDAYIMRYVR